MPRMPLSFPAVAVASLLAGAAMNHGCQDVKDAFTKLNYAPIRDMRRTVAFTPQKGSLRPPDSLSVPTSGREVMPNQDRLMTGRDAIAADFHNTVVADDSSLARGERLFTRLCVPCHGKTMVGDGLVSAKFMPPPDLLGATARGRTDGYIYTYIRYGGVIMPKYGHALTETETWHVINYLRHQQKVSPR